MPLLASYRRKKYFLKFIYLIGIIIIMIIFYKLFKFAPIDVPSENSRTYNFRQTQDHKNSTNYEISLHNSVFKGLSRNLEPYTVSADKADKISENTFNLEQVKANYEFGNNKLLINAKTGLLDNLNNFMDLKDDVQILFDNLILNTKEISFNLLTKEASSKVQVKMIYKNSQIEADSFTSKNNSSIINFKGNVSTRIKVEDF